MATGSNKQKPLKTGVPTPNQQTGWVVWLLSIATFVVTVLIVLGLFWAGRWVVHRVTKKSTPSATVTTVKVTAPSQTGVATDGRSTTNSGQPAPATNPTSAPTSAQTSNTNSSSTSAPTASTPKANPSGTLVNTGPTSDE